MDGNGMCPVCGDLASAYLHYGARVCYNCRGFFRRCVIKAAKGKTIFSCPFKCGNCNSCRYEKCLRVGMQPMWVKIEASGAKRKLSERSLPRGPRNLMEKFTRDECVLLHTLFDSFCNIMAQEWLFLHKKSPLIFSEFSLFTISGFRASKQASCRSFNISEVSSDNLTSFIDLTFSMLSSANWYCFKAK